MKATPPKGKNKKLTVALAIPTYNRGQVLVETLNSARRLRPGPDEVLVVDQTPRHEKAVEDYLRKSHKDGWIRWIRQQPPSVTAARNRAIAETRADVIIFTDDDVLMPKDFVARHMANYRDEMVQAVAGGVDQDKKPRYPPLPAGGWSHLLDYKYFSVFDQKRTVGVANFMGCNHSGRTEMFRRLGGFDTNFIGSALREETDMALRIWKSGAVIVFDPEARLTHRAAPSGGCRIPPELVKTHPEWWVAFNRHYFGFYHLFPSMEFWKNILYVDFRQTVLRKANLLRPWKIPWAYISYLYAMVKGALMALEKNRRRPRL